MFAGDLRGPPGDHQSTLRSLRGPSGDLQLRTHAPTSSHPVSDAKQQCCHRRTNVQLNSNMAAPKLTTCQVPPCANNPSFETFVASRANGQEMNGKHMSVVDILNDIKVSENNNKTGCSTFEEKRQMVSSMSKPVVCPKGGFASISYYYTFWVFS